MITALTPISPNASLFLPLTENLIFLPVLAINKVGFTPACNNTSITVCLCELNKLTGSPFNLTSIKSLPKLLIAVKAIPSTVTPADPISLSDTHSSIVLLSLMVILFSGILSSLATSSKRPGVCAPPPTKNTAAGAFPPFNSIIFVEIACDNFSTTGVISFLTSADAIVFSKPKTSV